MMKLLYILPVLIATVLHYTTRASFPVPQPNESVVLVTGASSGIGKHAAISLAAQGFTVFAGVRKEADGLAVESEAGTPNLRHVIVDVTKSEQIDAAVEAVETYCGESGRRFRALVNNAGVQEVAPMETVPMAKLRKLYDINVFGLVEMTQKFTPLLRAGGAGSRVVNIGSVAGFFTPLFFGIYSSSKHAVESITDAMRIELGDSAGIAVSLLEPGAIDTPIEAKMKSQIDSQTGGIDKDPYADKMKTFSNTMEAAEGVKGLVFSSVDATTWAITDGITSPTPRARYLVGPDAWALNYVVKHLPNALVDRVLSFLSSF